jgi:amphi-Trp domain-containing protein
MSSQQSTGETKEFRHQSYQNKDEIINYLNALAEGLKQGKLKLNREPENLELETPDNMKFEFRVKQKRDGVQVKVKFGWKHTPESIQSETNPLVIESGS